MKSRLSKILIIVTIIILNFGCDQISKSIVRKNVIMHQRISVIGENLVLTKVENKGAFLSFGYNLPQFLREVFLTYLPLLILLLALYYIFRNLQLPIPVIIALSFVIGGGIGNIYDRILYGSVTDFLHMDFYLFRTGIFNVADMSIMTGSILLLFYYVFNRSILQKKKEDMT